MVSLQTPNTPNQRKMILELENSSKRRNWEERETEEIFKKRSKPSMIIEKTKSIYDIEFHLEKPLPLEWQRCLDIQSGQVHFYNTMTQRRTSKDPRLSTEKSSPSPISLDLELNLPCKSLGTHVDDNWTKFDLDSPSSNNSSNPSKNFDRQMENFNGSMHRSSSILSIEADNQEMVATVCTRCHILVMLCMSSPACPNCKFMYPPDQSPTNLFKPRFRLLCCKD